MSSQLRFQVRKKRTSKIVKNDENFPHSITSSSRKGKANSLGQELEQELKKPNKLPRSSNTVLCENQINIQLTPTKNTLGKIGSSPLKKACQNLFTSPRKNSPLKNSPAKCLLSPTKSPRKSISFSSPKKSSPQNSQKLYQQLKQSLATGSASNFVGRETERKILQDFLDSHILISRPGSLYVSGAPGTGKTASVTALVEQMQVKDLKQVYINCMSHKSTKDIFIQVASQFGIKVNNQTESNILKSIEKAITGSKPVLLILDEIDQLDSKNQSVLYTIFEWPSLAKSKLVLVGIANMLDLTDRILPRLQSSAACRPELLNFPPYTKPEIVEIINARVKAANLGEVELIKPSAISFLAGKIASVAGDVRKALDVCRRAVELVEGDARKQAKITNSSIQVRPVDIVKVNILFNEVYGSKITNDAANHPNSIPLQQKVLICTFLLFLKYAKSKIVTIAKLHEVYCRVCTKQKLPAIGQSEFLSLCFLLESRGILEVKKTKEPRNSKVFLRLSLEESEQALGDKNLMAAILEDKESLGKLCSKK